LISTRSTAPLSPIFHHSAAKLPDGKRLRHEWIALNPRRADRSPGSFSVNLQTGKWGDFAVGDTGGDVVSLAAYLFNTTQVDAARTLAVSLGVQ